MTDRRVVGSLTAKQMLMQKLATMTSGSLGSLVVQRHCLLSVEGRAHSWTHGTKLCFLHGQRFLHLYGVGNRVLRNERKILDVQFEVKQLVEVELLQLSLLIDKALDRRLNRSS